jgi:hypothetical protein
VTQRQHKHAALRSQQTTRAFRGCVLPDDCRPVAHGNIRIEQVCRCGARRAINSNGGQLEYGRWSDAGE